MLARKELKLYEVQDKIVNQCRETMRYYKKIILQAATGVGKTVIATWMAREAYKKDLRILFVCDRISLIDQTSEMFDAYGLNHGIFQADNPMYAPDFPIQIGSIQTLARRKQRDYDFIILDEIHTFYKSHEKILKHNPDAYVLGLTATPFTKGLGKYFDKHIEPVPVKELIKLGYLCSFEIYSPQVIDVSGIRTVAGEYKQDELGKAADKPELVADVVRTWKQLGQNKKTIMFCVNVAHGRHLQKVFLQQGIKAKEINGYMLKEGDEGANQIIKDFRNNKFKILISTEMLVKGFDVPDVECIVFATATKSHIKFIQACGRGLRIFDGKEKCRILDHGSNAERLGFPDEYEFIELDDGKQQRSKNKKAKKEKLPKKCPSCDFLKPAGVQKCPACKFIPKFIEDVEIEDGELKKLQRKTRSEYSLQEKQSFLAQLNQYCCDTGGREHRKGFYGAAIYAYADKFGCRPSSKMKWNAFEQVGDDVKKYMLYRKIKYAKGKQKKAQESCSKCGSKKFALVNSGPHRKLTCAGCNEYIKFVNKDEEKLLRKRGQIK